MTVTSTDGNVIHADFSRPKFEGLSIRITSEVLYADGDVILVRSQIGSRSGDTATTYFLAHRERDRVEILPVSNA